MDLHRVSCQAILNRNGFGLDWVLKNLLLL